MTRVMNVLGCLLFCATGLCQPVHLPSENGYIKTAAYSEHFMDAFSFIANPACLGGTKEFLSAALLERKWMLKELDNYEMAVACPVGKAALGFTFQRSGDADYSEQGMQLAYGKNLGRLELGIRFGYLRDQVAGYQDENFGSSGVGIRFHVSEKLIAGWEIGLPVFSKAGQTNTERAPAFFRMGFGYESGTDIYLALEVEKTAGIPMNVTPCLEYRYGEQFFFSFGISSYAGALYFKTGWKKNRLCIQLYTRYEPVLGFSPGLVLLWEWKNKKA